MPTEALLVDVTEGVATLTMNRPERLNALSQEMSDSLRAHLQEFSFDRSVRCIVLTGAGRGFCAGGDVTRMVDGGEQPSFEESVARGEIRHRLSLMLHDIPKPVIAMVNGAAAGAGLSLAMACDIRIAGTSARFGTAFARVGYSGDYGGSWLLTQLVGTARARELYFTAEVIGADEALRIGLVNRVVADESLRDETMAFAQRLASGPSVAHGYIKENMNLSQYTRFADMISVEARAQGRTAQTEDHKEGARAFLEKRPPVFQGR